MSLPVPEQQTWVAWESSVEGSSSSKTSKISSENQGKYEQEYHYVQFLPSKERKPRLTLPTMPPCTTLGKNLSNFLCCPQPPNGKQTPYPRKVWRWSSSSYSTTSHMLGRILDFVTGDQFGYLGGYRCMPPLPPPKKKKTNKQTCWNLECWRNIFRGHFKKSKHEPEKKGVRPNQLDHPPPTPPGSATQLPSPP